MRMAVAASTRMLAQLERLTAGISALQNRLILLVGPPRSGKTALLRALGQRRGVTPLNLGSALGRELLLLPQRQRRLRTGNALRELIERQTPEDLLLLDNIELLFAAALNLNPLELLRQQAHSRKVIAVWPGELCDGRLTYAEINHPEHCDYPAQSVVILAVQP